MLTARYLKTRKKLTPVIVLMFGTVFSLSGQYQGSPEKIKNERAITIDYQLSDGMLNTMYRECVGAGRANEGLRADWQQQLAMTKRDCGFRYIRMHGLLCDDMGVYREDRNGNPEYNYQYIDVLFDYILSIGMKPFVELGFMPGALASGSQTIFWWKGNITPPKDYDRWEELIRNLVLHFTERYGEQEVKRWYFEVWNEPNLTNGFWAGTQDEYFKLYAYSARAIKSVSNEYRVGGPATAGAAWVPEMIGFCAANAVPIDFVSTHSYGVRQGYLDEYGVTGTILDSNRWSVSGDVINTRKQISTSQMPDLELHYTEWSSSYTPADPIHDSYHQAAYILEKLKQTGNAANSMSYWVFTDIFEEAGPRFTPFHGGFGLLNYQGIRKPAYYAYYLLNKLGETELHNTDSSSWACKNSGGDVQVLLWDYTYTHPGDSVNNQEYYIRDLPSKPSGSINIEINNIPKGRYQLEVYRIGYKTNDPFTTYIAMGKPSQLSRQQAEEIKQLNDGSPVSSEIVNIGPEERFVRIMEINENDVIMLNLVKL